MIQRIQSIYLFMSALLSALLPMFFPLWKDAKQMPVYFTSDINIYCRIWINCN